MSYDCVLLDLDGSVYVGPTVVAGVPEAIAALRSAGLRVAFVTNDPLSSRDQYVDRLAGFGIPCDPQHVFSAAWATAQLIAEELPGGRVLALGSAAFRAEHEQAGLLLVDTPAEADAVSIAGDRSFGHDELVAAVRGVLDGAALYGANRDRTYPAEGGPSPATGTLVAAVEYATEAQARACGKPERVLFDEARRSLGAGRYLMCGDRLDSDVAGGAAAEMHTALVLTGSHSRVDLAAWQGPQPTYVLDSAAALPGVCGL